MFFAPSKSRERAKIQNIGVSKTSDPIQIKFKIPNPYQEPPASSKDKNQNLKDMDVVCILKSRWRAKIWNLVVSKTNDPIQILVKMPNPSQGPLASSKAKNQDLKDMNFLCTFIIKIKRGNLA